MAAALSIAWIVLRNSLDMTLNVSERTEGNGGIAMPNGTAAATLIIYLGLSSKS